VQEFIIGDASGTARLVCWAPDLFADVDEGASISIDGVQRKEDEGIVEYVVSDSAEIRILPDEIGALTRDAADVTEGQNPVVTGIVSSVSDVRTFTTRRGTESRVRNVSVQSSSKKSGVNVAIWGDAADALFLPGDPVQVINAAAKLNRYGELELSVGRGSAIRTINLPGKSVSLTGIIIPRPEGLSLDDGKEVWILLTNESPVPGTTVDVEGICRNGRIEVTNLVSNPIDADPLIHRLGSLL